MKRWGRYPDCDLVGVPAECSCLYCPFSDGVMDCKGAPASGIAFEMAESKISIQRVAKLSGFSERMIRDFISGKRDINHVPGEMLVALADAIECDIHGLLEQKPRKK